MAVNVLPLLTAPTGGQEDFTTLDRRKQAMALAQELLKDSMSSQPIQSHWQGVNKMAQALVAGMIDQRERSKDAADQKEAFNLLFGGAQGGQTGGSSAADALPKSPASSPMGALPGMSAVGDFFSRLGGSESGNDPNAKAKTSSATGIYQFTDGTWADLAKNNPDLGLTPDGRTDPAQQQRAIQVFTKQNGNALQGAGIEPTSPNLKMAHFLGANGAVGFLRGMQQNPDAPGHAYADPAAVRANQPVFFNRDGSARSAQQVYGFLTRGLEGVPSPFKPTQVASLGGTPSNDAPAFAPPVAPPVNPDAAQTTPQAAPQQVAQAQPPQSPQVNPPQNPLGGMSREQMWQLYKNPYTRSVIQGALQKQFNTTSEIKVLPDGSVIAVNPRTNAVTPIYQSKQPTKFDDIGTDPVTGERMKGFVDSDKRDVQPYRVPGTQQPNSVVPPVPPGVDPKVWREGQSKSVLTNSLPMSSDDSTKLRKEIQDLPSYKNYQQAFPIYRSMQETAGRNTRASDLNLVYGLAKIFDPTSVVREGEMVMVRNTSSLPEWLVGSINQINGGAALQPNTRDAVMQEAFTRMKAYEETYSLDTDHYKGIVTRNRGNVEDVIPALKPIQPWKPKPPESGNSPNSPSPEWAAPPSGAAPTIDDINKELQRRGLQ